MIQSTPQHPATDPIVAATLLVIAMAAAVWHEWKTEHRIHPSTILWPLPFLASEILVATWGIMGICRADASSICIHAVTTLICGVIPILRRPFLDWLDKQAGVMPHAICIGRDVLLIAATSVISVVSLETACNSERLAGIPSAFFYASALIIFLIMLILYFAGQRCGSACCIAVAACCGFGIAEHFVIEFKGAALLPSDLLAMGTAMAVSEGYHFTFNADIVTSLTWAAVACALLSLISPPRPSKRSHVIVNVGVNIMCALITWSCVSSAFANVKLEDALDFSYDRWWPISSYQTYGFIPVFTATAQNFEIEQPDNYSDVEAQDIQAQLAAQYDAGRGSSPERQAAVTQYNELKPTVITIMNETFSDLSLFEALRDAGYAGPQYFNSIPDALIRGSLMASITGGGTANTEFEYLTNDSLGFIGSGKYPYSLYSLEHVDSLAKQFSNAGYRTLAMHPNLPDNWNRRTAYQSLGFSKFLSIDDFQGAPSYHSGVTDAATYDKILEELNKSGDPQFILDVTMQNHGGYDAGTVPDEDLTHYAPMGLDDDTCARMNVYLTCIEKSDQELSAFMEQLRALDRPVVLVFFGDHQPTVSTAMNDELYAGENSLEHTARIYSSNYFVWANYDVAGAEQISQQEAIGASELSARVLDLIGAPLTDYQKALLATRQDVPAFSGVCYVGADGQLYALDGDSPYAAVIDHIRRMQYLNFARKL